MPIISRAQQETLTAHGLPGQQAILDFNLKVRSYEAEDPQVIIYNLVNFNQRLTSDRADATRNPQLYSPANYSMTVLTFLIL